MQGKFQYKPRNQESWEKREKQSAGNFIGFILDSLDTYTVRKGENWTRILPPTWAEAAHYGMDIWVHYGIGPQNASVLCLLKMKNQPCPACEGRAIAEDEGKEELAKELKPTRRVLVWMIDRKDEKKPLLWPMAWTVDRDISKIARDRQTGELYQLDHPEEGFDISFDVEGEAQTRKYTGFQLARRASSVAEAHLTYVVEHPLPDCLIWRNYSEVMELLANVPSHSQSSIPASTTSNVLQMPNGLSPRQQDEWEKQHGQAPVQQQASQQRATVTETVLNSPTSGAESASSATQSAQRAQVSADPAPTTLSRSEVANDPNPTESAQGTSSAGAAAAESKPAEQQGAQTMSRAEALRARFAKK